MALETNLVFIKNTASSPTLTFGFGLNGICQLNLKWRQSLFLFFQTETRLTVWADAPNFCHTIDVIMLSVCVPR